MTTFVSLFVGTTLTIYAVILLVIALHLCGEALKDMLNATLRVLRG